MRNEHKYDFASGRCDMSSMAPTFIIGWPEMFLDQSYEVKCLINHRTVVAGRVTPARDEHGNARFYATSSILEDKEMYGWAKGAVEWWLTCIALVHAQ